MPDFASSLLSWFASVIIISSAELSDLKATAFCVKGTVPSNSNLDPETEATKTKNK